VRLAPTSARAGRGTAEDPVVGSPGKPASASPRTRRACPPARRSIRSRS